MLALSCEYVVSVVAIKRLNQCRSSMHSKFGVGDDLLSGSPNGRGSFSVFHALFLRVSACLSEIAKGLVMVRHSLVKPLLALRSLGWV